MIISTMSSAFVGSADLRGFGMMRGVQQDGSHSWVDLSQVKGLTEDQLEHFATCDSKHLPEGLNCPLSFESFGPEFTGADFNQTSKSVEQSVSK
jgi:hypothetical protein